MNSLEVMRVLAVLEEAATGLRVLSYVTEDVVLAPGPLQDALGEDVCQQLEAVARVLQAREGPIQQPAAQQQAQQHGQGGAQGQQQSSADAAALKATVALLRALRASPSAEADLASLQAERSDAALQGLEVLQQMVSQVRRRLGTTVQEDASRREHQAVLRERHERAAGEKLQLEHRLKLHRAERARQLTVLQSAQDASASELATLHADSSAARAAAESAASAEEAADEAEFQEQHTALAREVEAAQRELAALRDETRAAAVAARRARQRAEGACEAAVAEYDAEVGARARELAVAEAAHGEVTAQIEAAQAELEALRRERVAHEEALRAAAAEVKRNEAREFRRQASAYVIQNAWKAYRKRRAAEAKAGGAGGTSASGNGKKGPKAKGKRK